MRLLSTGFVPPTQYHCSMQQLATRRGDSTDTNDKAIVHGIHYMDPHTINQSSIIMLRGTAGVSTLSL